MDREQLSITVQHTDEGDTDSSKQPLLCITCHGPASDLNDALPTPDGEISGECIDVAVRLQPPVENEPERAVLSLSQRVTGQFILEAPLKTPRLWEFIDAANQYAAAVNTEHCFSLRVQTHDEHVAIHDKRTLLVYDSNGVLLRTQSLIPHSIEI